MKENEFLRSLALASIAISSTDSSHKDKEDCFHKA